MIYANTTPEMTTYIWRSRTLRLTAKNDGVDVFDVLPSLSVYKSRGMHKALATCLPSTVATAVQNALNYELGQFCSTEYDSTVQ